MENAEAASALESLGNPTRLAIFRNLVRAGPTGMPVGKLKQQLAVPGSTLSHHLSHLMKYDLVTQQREGRVLRCNANYQKMNELLTFLTLECCRDDAACN